MHREEVSFPFESSCWSCVLTFHSLALVEMKMLLREVYSRFATTVAPDMHGSMKLDDQIISARPKGQTCMLIFTEI
jgi:hypothetical protein